MKRTLILLFFFSALGFGQETLTRLEDLTVNGVALLGKSKDHMVQAFGQPLKTEHFDTLEKSIYNYPGLEIIIDPIGITYVEITDSRYRFTKYNIRVGQDVREVQKKIDLRNDTAEDGVTGTNDYSIFNKSFFVNVETVGEGIDKYIIKEIFFFL